MEEYIEGVMRFIISLGFVAYFIIFEFMFVTVILEKLYKGDKFIKAFLVFAILVNTWLAILLGYYGGL